MNCQVGAIEVDENDSKGCSFTIQVLGRLYHLRANSRASCRDWVITLNRVKEARLQQGNVKLVDLPFQQPVDLLDQNDDIVAPRIVVVANRQRTRAVDESQELERLMNRVGDENNDPVLAEMKRRSTIGTVVLARWTKRKTSIQRLRAKLAKWARSVRKYGCGQADSVQLDLHVHPPGHDDKRRRLPSASQATKTSSQSGGESLNAWIGKEAAQSAQAGGGQVLARPLPAGKPQGMQRGISAGSEDDARYLS